MPIPDFDRATLLRGLQAHYPRGAIWRREAGSVQAQCLAALVPTFQRVTVAGKLAIPDIFPGSALSVLPEWEWTLGLPDPCAGLEPSIALRQGQVLARLGAGVGATVPALVNFAARLGYAISIAELAPARHGQARHGTPCYGVAWAHVWVVHAPQVTVTSALYGAAHPGDPYAAWGNAVLQCEMQRLAPADTLVQFAYP